jgi:hypothetical protein
VVAGARLKIRDLTRVEGGSVVAAWPPRWVGSFHPGTAPTPEDGVLEFVMHAPHNTILALTMRFDGREHTGILNWDAPPAAVAVANILKTNLGAGIGVLGDLDVVE